MSNLQPTQITDKNGKQTTVHKRVDSPTQNARELPVTAPIAPANAQVSTLPIAMTESELSEVLGGFEAVALFTATHYPDPEDGEEEGEPVEMDTVADSGDFSDEARASARAKVEKFITDNPDLVEEALDRDGYDLDDLGGDLSYTINGHGTGFWDRELLKEGGLGEKLTEAAREAGGMDLYLGDDKKLYYM
jgi:hypothetical protein